MRISDWSSDVCSSDLLNGPEKHICGVQVRRHIAAYDSSIAQGNEGVAGARRAQFAVASAMNELMHLSEEFDLPNAAPATLQVIARPECLPLRIMVPDAAREVGDLVRSEERRGGKEGVS